MTRAGRGASMAGVTDSRDVDAACLAAEAAAHAAGVEVRTLETLDELALVRPLYERIWRTERGKPPVTTDLLQAMRKAGSYVCGAFDGGEMVGACIGFFAEPARRALHSHIAGVATSMQGRSVGFALKLHQRSWAMLRGVREIAWTFDPLIRRNAYFNIVKLAADPTEYLPNLYGRLADELNGEDDTDRAVAVWRLTAPEVVAACNGRRRASDAAAVRAAGAVVGLDISPTGRPLAGRVEAGAVLVAVPGDIEALRISDPECAAAWRVAVRDVLGGLLIDGARVRGFDPSGWYIVDTKDAQ